jgi:hypothetical protein
MPPVQDGPVSFDKDIKPLFRERDRSAMEWAFDLWSFEDVSGHAEAILSQLSAGTMPCDRRWPDTQISLFRRWVESGKSE